MENKIRFGPAGNGEIFYLEGNKHSRQAPAWLKSKGLSAYEYSFGRGFTLKSETAKEIGSEALKNDILVSVHAPYYINFANESDEMAEKSYNYVTKSIEFLKLLNGKKVVVHLASQGKLDRAHALELTKQRIFNCLERVYNLYDMTDTFICPETMGKYLQIGNYNEIIELCTLDKCLVPTFDFGHINCTLQGNLKTSDDYKRIIDLSFEKLGEFKTKNCHIHFSKIQFGDKGELRHLDFDDMEYGPEFLPLASAIKEYKMTPTIICESSSKMAEDAMMMREIYSMLNN